MGSRQYYREEQFREARDPWDNPTYESYERERNWRENISTRIKSNPKIVYIGLGIIILAILVVIGIILGVVLGSKKKEEGKTVFGGI